MSIIVLTLVYDSSCIKVLTPKVHYCTLVIVYNLDNVNGIPYQNELLSIINFTLP